MSFILSLSLWYLYLLAGAQLLGLHVVHTHDFFDSDVVFAGELPKAIAGFDRVQNFFRGGLGGNGKRDVRDKGWFFLGKEAL